MTMPRLIRAEFRKLTTTKMPWVFLAVLAAMAAINALAVVAGTDMDGSKAFISTEADQRSLVAFAANALLGAALFGAIAVAREYGHHTVVPTFLASPRRHRAVVAQLIAIAVVGGVLSMVGSALIIVAVAASLPTTEYGLLLSVGGMAEIVAAASIAGAVGSVLGAGIGALVRNVGGAVTTTFLVLFVAPPLVVQLASGTASWMPSTLANVLSGVTSEVGQPAAIVALVLWALVPAAVGLFATNRRDVV